MRLGIEPASSWILVRFVSTEPQRELGITSICGEGSRTWPRGAARYPASPERPSLTVSQREFGAPRGACASLQALLPVGTWRGPLLSDVSLDVNRKPVTLAPSLPHMSPEPFYSSHQKSGHQGPLVRKGHHGGASLSLRVGPNRLMAKLIPRAFWYSLFGHA